VTTGSAAFDRDSDVWVIEPRREGLVARAAELWRYRHLLTFFATRAIQKSTQRTLLGRLWLFIRPLGPILIGTLIFGGLLKVPSDRVPYFLFFLVGTMSWTLFEHTLLWTTRSLEMNKQLVTKLYFPRIILPLATAAPAAVEFLIYAGLMAGALAYYYITTGVFHLTIGFPLLVAALATVLAPIFAVAVGLFTAVWQTRYRDVRFTLRYLMRFWFYMTPVIYPMSQIPSKWRWVAALNPMSAIVESFKYGTLGIGEFRPGMLGMAVAMIVATLLAGLWYFNRTEAASIDKL
jgi:lipopolysaccharide transport system permease protein